MNILAQARSLQPYMLDARRRLHAKPELGFEEYETSDYVANQLESLGYTITRLSPTGVLGELNGTEDGKTVLLRADIDALPVTEETGLPFASQHNGLCHACGHDVHTAMLLGAAKLLADSREKVKGCIKLLFQPAEETGQGAQKMIAQGVLDGVDACFAEHIAPQTPVGMVATSEGELMAGAGTFKITVCGKACHGAMPQLGADALLAGAQIVVALQSIVSRETSPTTPLVITVGRFTSGNRYNVVSGEAELEGTVRSLDGALLKNIGAQLERVAASVAAAHRCTAQTEYEKTCESLAADPMLTDILRQAANKTLGDSRSLVKLAPQMGSEDFSYIAAKCPSAFAIIGAGGSYPLHSGKMNIDENAMPVGAALYAQFALDYLA